MVFFNKIDSHLCSKSYRKAFSTFQVVTSDFKFCFVVDGFEAIFREGGFKSLELVHKTITSFSEFLFYCHDIEKVFNSQVKRA